MAGKTERHVMTLKYPATTGRSEVTDRDWWRGKDQDDHTHFFADASILDVTAGTTIEVERTGPRVSKNPKYANEKTYDVKSWKPLDKPDHVLTRKDNGPDLFTPPKPNYRQQAHPVDAKQMWINGLGQPWMAAYAQMLSITTDGTMKKVDPDVVEQAMRAIMTVGERLFGGTYTITPKKIPLVEDDMDDGIPNF